VDTCGKNYPALQKLKILFTVLYKYALQNDIGLKNYAQYIDMKQYKDRNPNKTERVPFSKEELDSLWIDIPVNEYYSSILMLIYSGVRISELLDLKKEHVNLEGRWFDVVASKTASGIRKVPIAKKVYPFFEYWYHKNNCPYLLSDPNAKKFSYFQYYNSYWIPMMDRIGISKHKPHDTRHTCVTLLTAAGIEDKMIKKIVGHKRQGVTENVYTHFDIQQLIHAIDLI
jgi:integrase